jgi:CubicO group peptidase (beta-lactamase class C family)
VNPPPARDALEAKRAPITELLRAEAERRKLPSLAFGVVDRAGLVYFVGLGARDAGGAPVTPDTVYRIGSITKTFTGLALLALRDAGKLHLDDPVAAYVPELAGARTADAGPITIRHLVTHTSGIPRLGALRYGDGHEVSLLELRDAARGVVLEHAPGTRALYSNLAMALAGPVIARASGQSYRAFVAAHLLAPLGMHATVWDREAVPADTLAQGFAAKGDGWVDCGAHWRFGAAEALGGLYSNVADMSRYVAFQLDAWPARDGDDHGPVRRSSVRESQLVAGFARAGQEAFGVNWIVKHDPKLGHVVFHNGGTEGYHAALWMLPERGLGVIALGPAASEIDGISFRALEALAAEVPPLLGAAARAGLDRLRALLAAPERAAVEQAFAPGFLEHVPADQILALLHAVATNAGAVARERVLAAASPNAAKAELTCAAASVLVDLEVEPAPPHRIRSLVIKPR